jgi:putative restriction endonuclease
VHNIGMRGYVGVTDDEWYRFLAARPGISEAEVNFWRPGGGREFRALAVGEPFFFKTHAPHNRVVGGGFFSGFAALRTSEAWQMFGEANGATSLERMRERIAHYRREPIGPHDDPEIGCVFVRNVAFFPDRLAHEPPPGFASNIVQGKSYDMADRQVAGYFGDLMQLVLGIEVEIDFSQPWHAAGPVFGDPRLSPHRLAQQSFKAVVLSAYHGHCAITDTKIRPVLQAAHIRPVSDGGENRLDNGLLLRSDVHTMFDRGYLAVDPSHRLLVSPRLRDEFGNGEQFYAKAGQVITLPDRKADRPQRDFLEWHLDTVFKAS